MGIIAYLIAVTTNTFIGEYMDFLGFNISKIKDEEKKGKTFVQPSFEDGAVELESNDMSNYSANMGYTFDLDAVPESEFELAMAYRNLAIQPDIDEAIQEIINEAIITDDLKDPISLILEDVDLSQGIKNKIKEEFDYILKLLDFKNNGYGIFRKWYVDGRIYFHKVIDKSSSSSTGIEELVPIDPMNIKMIREYKTETKKDRNATDIDIFNLAEIEEYYIYSRVPFNSEAHQEKKNAVRIPKEAVAFAPSGLLSINGKQVLSYLYKSIKPFNDLKLLEDSVVIYRVTRAPERRIFYVDVGSLPKGKADQYLKDVMNRFKNKIVYDVTKGTINNRKKFQSMIEDYWLPRREGGRGTEVSTLPGGEQLGELSDVEYFKTKLYKSLNVPLSRFQGDSSAFNIGRTTEITRDEIKFNKYIQRLRRKFSEIFNDLLKTQVLLKKVMTSEEWNDIEPEITYSFLEDNYFSELKEVELMNDRVGMLSTLQSSEAIGKYYSHEFIRKEVLKQSEDDIIEMDKQIAEEKNDEQYYPVEDDGMGGGGFGGEPTEPEEPEEPVEPKPEPVVEPDEDEDEDEQKDKDDEEK